MNVEVYTDGIFFSFQGAIEEQKLVTVANTIFKQRVLTLAFPMEPCSYLKPHYFGSFRMSFS